MYTRLQKSTQLVPAPARGPKCRTISLSVKAATSSDARA